MAYLDEQFFLFLQKLQNVTFFGLFLASENAKTHNYSFVKSNYTLFFASNFYLSRNYKYISDYMSTFYNNYV